MVWFICHIGVLLCIDTVPSWQKKTRGTIIVIGRHGLKKIINDGVKANITITIKSPTSKVIINDYSRCLIVKERISY